MKRVVLLLLLALPLAAAEKWFEAYDRGVAAVNTRNYKGAAEALQKAVAEMPNEATGLRVKSSLITYVPHFWLGIAKFNLGDVDGALREWRICEEQGVLASTDYYARMKDWVARAQVEKQRKAADAASGSKKAADSAISKALEMQLDALSAGGDRAESYLAAQRKLQEARAQFQKGGTDVAAYRAAEQTAQQAKALFSAAAEEGKKIRAARAVVVPKPAVKKPVPAPVPIQQAPVQQAQVIAPPPVVVVQQPPPVVKKEPAVIPVVTEAEATKQIEKQEERRRELERPDLRLAYRAFAKGDLASADRLLTNIVAKQPAAEALLLRGCARYTRAMLARDGGAMLNAAANDFRAALAKDAALRLDDRAFSPKLVAFFDGVRKQR
ncbi:MAG: hypothetical protein QOJ98_647 [Acidobacteriota bacterium]|jgi:hypothetical protein|nr:hypothetical protein [Acidobacteriota bacterium]